MSLEFEWSYQWPNSCTRSTNLWAQELGSWLRRTPRHTGVTENDCSPRTRQGSKPKACITMPDNHYWRATDAAPYFKIDSLSNLKHNPNFNRNSLSLILENRWLWLPSRLYLSSKMCTQLCANSVCVIHCLGYEIVSKYKNNLIWKG